MERYPSESPTETAAVQTIETKVVPPQMGPIMQVSALEVICPGASSLTASGEGCRWQDKLCYGWFKKAPPAQKVRLWSTGPVRLLETFVVRMPDPPNAISVDLAFLLSSGQIEPEQIAALGTLTRKTWKMP